ncbi:MAG: glucosamine--fructose-6-phosphate aminotransferase [Bellilinea sp.]|nr:MAG: glucosamine--fructose-6-phosphate aminotransferase [Bellilinea sp.]
MTTMNHNPYVQDILSQPQALRAALQGYPSQALKSLAADLLNAKIDRILITGMGASLNGSYPSVLRLSRLPLPVQWVETSELAHFTGGQITPRTLLWVISQSGRSAEIVRLLEICREKRAAALLAVTNETDSPLAAAADFLLPLNAGAEYTVSTRTYLNTLAVMGLAATQILDEPFEPALDAFYAAADSAESYLARLEDHRQSFSALAKNLQNLLLVGRGSSLAAVFNGALVLKEAAKFYAEGMSAAQFRHGPFELVDHHFYAAVFGGDEPARRLNLNLANDILRHGGQAVWIDSQPEDSLTTWMIPPSAPLTRPVLEILPVQVLSIVLAELRGVVPGQFRHLGKVVLQE